jgi:molybdate transport system permease protein
MRANRMAAGRSLLVWMQTTLLVFLLLPLLAVIFSMNPVQLWEKLHTPTSYLALLVSMRTSTVALILIFLFGTPLAYALSKSQFRGKKFLEVALQMPVVTPPAVAGVGLLLVFGQMGLLGHPLSTWGIQIAFQETAVILAQMFIATPFYVATVKQTFDAIDDQYIAVSRTLGVNAWRTFWRVTFPLSLPGILSGMTLSWARALGEFGATMMFAGNMPGKTQTLPLAIYSAMQEDLDEAVAISALLLAVAFLLLLLVGWFDWKIRSGRTAS